MKGKVVISEIVETWCNATENYNCGDSGWYKPYTDDSGRLFRSLQRDFGRCISKMYRDRKGMDDPIFCGWVFQKRVKYENSRETYLQETWVEVRWSYEFAA